MHALLLGDLVGETVGLKVGFRVGEGVGLALGEATRAFTEDTSLLREIVSMGFCLYHILEGRQSLLCGPHLRHV